MDTKNIIAWIRIFIWGFCPRCNSDAPEMDECPVCEHDTSSPFSIKKRKELWKKHKYYLSFKYFKFQKRCGAKTFDTHPCDFTKWYRCHNCELGR
jgi:hypothetical protein